MARLAQTAGLTEIQQEILATVKTFVDKEIIPHANGARARRRVPDRHRRRDEGDGAVRPHDPRGVRRARRVAADLRAGRRADRAGLDERLRRDQHPLHRGVHDHPARHATSRRRSTCRGWPRARCAGRSRCPSRTWAPTSRRSRRGPSQDGDDFVIDGAKMWLTNGGTSNLTAVLVDAPTRARREALPEPHLLPGREARRLRRGRAGADRPREDRQDGLQGRGHHRDGVRRLPHVGASRSSAASAAPASRR